MKSSKFVGVLTVLFGIAIGIGPWTFVRVCSDMSDSAPLCHKTRLYAMALGVIILLLGIIMMLLRHKILAGLFSLVITAGGVVTILLPLFIAPVCEVSAMTCRSKTMPFLLVAGCILTVIGVLSAVYMFKSRKKRPPASVQQEPMPAQGSVRPEGPVRPERSQWPEM